jgi:predicted ATPase
LNVSHSYGGKSLHEQSHGESFFALIDRRFHGDGIYLLDEPEAALSPTRQMSLLAILHRHISDGSQFIIATHSPIIMAYPDAYIYSFGANGTRRVEYEETEHVRVTRDFLTRREKMLEILLSDDE